MIGKVDKIPYESLVLGDSYVPNDINPIPMPPPNAELAASFAAVPLWGEGLKRKGIKEIKGQNIINEN